MTRTEWIVHPNRSEIGPDEPGQNGHYRTVARPRPGVSISTCLGRVKLPRRMSDLADADGSITFGGRDWWFVVGAARTFARTHIDPDVLPPFGFKRSRTVVVVGQHHHRRVDPRRIRRDRVRPRIPRPVVPELLSHVGRQPMTASPAGLDLHTLRGIAARRRGPVARQQLDRIAEHLDEHDGFVSWSGGKDSTVVVDLARQVDPHVPIVFFDSGLQFPETIAVPGGPGRSVAVELSRHRRRPGPVDCADRSRRVRPSRCRIGVCAASSPTS